MANENRADDDIVPLERTLDPETNLPVLGVTQYYDRTDDTYTKAIASGRQRNVLSEFASYTYNITLYMVTPEAYQIFIASGSIDVTAGFYIVASSGGEANTLGTPTIAKNKEFFIDDLSFKTVISPKTSASATLSHTFDFKIVEPYGFSLTSILKNKIEEISQETSITKGNTDPLKAFYVLAVRFRGYSDNGNYKNQDVLAVEQGQGTKTRSDILPVGTSYFPITFAEFSFKLDGKGTVYNVKGVPQSNQEAYSITTSQIQNPSELSGTTIGDILGNAEGTTGLTGLLNKKGKELRGQYANTYKIILDPKIANTRIIAPERYDKLKTKGAYATDADKVSALNGLNGAGYNPNSRSFSVTRGMSITKFIDNVILTSEYVTNSLNTIYSEDAQTEATPNSDEQGLTWYMINPIVVPKDWDPNNKTNVFDITYYVAPYKVPYIRSKFVTNSKKTPYYGAFKYYDYYFTGKNTEVISFDITYNNLYFIPGKSNTTSQPTETSSEPVSSSPDMKNVGMETAEAKAGNPVGSIKTSLYSPGDQATAKIQILGDPDWLMTTLGTTPNATNPREAAYGKNYSINPVNGQCFIEVNFYEGTDYDTTTGLMNVNKNVQFYSVDTSDTLQGIVFMVTEVTSSFSRGKFTQDLNLVLWPEAELRKSGVIPSEGRETQGTNTNTNTPTNNSNATGFAASNQTPPVANQTNYVNEGQQFVIQTNQSVVTAITNTPPNLATVGNNTTVATNSAPTVSVAFNQTANYYATSSSVVDDDGISTAISNQPALSYGAINLGRET